MKEYNSKDAIPISEESLFRMIKDYKPFRKFDVSIRVKDGRALFKNIAGILNLDGDEVRIYPDYRFNAGSEIVYELFSKAFEIDKKNLHNEGRTYALWQGIKQRFNEMRLDLCESDYRIENMVKSIKIGNTVMDNPFLKTIEMMTELLDKNCSVESLTSNEIEKIISGLPKLNDFKRFDEYEEELTSDEKLQVFMGMMYLYNIGFEKRYPEIKGSLICPLSKLFEYYVLNRLRKVFSTCSIEYQKKIQYIDTCPDKKKVGMRPDFIIDCNKDVLVLDAKQKSFEHKNCYDDLHQISAYVLALRRNGTKCLHGVLVYPQTNNGSFDNVFGNRDEWFFFTDFDDEDGGFKILVEMLKKERTS